MSGMDFLGIQELGGQKDLSPPWQPIQVGLDGLWNFYVCNPPLAFRAVAVGIHSRHFNSVEKVTPFSCGIAVILKRNSARTFVISAHLPHRQRHDCIQTWQTFHAELEQILRQRRLHDTIVILHDINYELGAIDEMENPNSCDERGFIARNILQQFGLVHTKPDIYTWSNSRGSCSKIDYILVSTPTINLESDQVHVDTDFLLGCDHRAVSTAFQQPSARPAKTPRATRSRNKCGQWRIDGSKAMPACDALAERIEIHNQDFKVADLELLAQQVSYRPKSHRYRDPPISLTSLNNAGRLLGRKPGT